MRIFLNRPDHLARAAQEALSGDAAEAESLSRVVDPSIPVIALTTTSTGQPALLSTQERADPVARAIRDAVLRLRGSL